MFVVESDLAGISTANDAARAGMEPIVIVGVNAGGQSKATQYMKSNVGLGSLTFRKKVSLPTANARSMGIK